MSSKNMITHIKKGFLSLLPQNKFARSVSVLIGGTASAQILVILIAPILTRLYTPDDFGLVAVFTGLLVLINVISSLRYELAIPLPENDNDAVNIVALCLFILLCTTILTTIIALFFNLEIAVILGVPKLADYFLLFPLGVFLSGIYSIFNYCALRSKIFKTLAYTKLQQTLVSIIIRLTLFKFGGISLLIAQIVSQSFGAIVLGKHIITLLNFKQLSFTSIYRISVRYWRFPVFTTWAGLLNNGGNQLPPLIFSALFSVGSAGAYALTHGVLAIPMRVIGGAVRDVFFSNVSKAYRDGELSLLVGNVFDKLAQIAMPITLILIIVSPELFIFVFGESWKESGEFARWMSPWLFLQFCVGPLVTVFAAIEKQHIGLIMQLQLFITRNIMIFIGAISGDIQTTIILFSVGSAVSYAIFLLVICYVAKVTNKIIFRSLSRAVLLSGISVLPLFYLFQVSEPQSFLVITSVLTTIFLLVLRYILLYRYEI